MIIVHRARMSIAPGLFLSYSFSSFFPFFSSFFHFPIDNMHTGVRNSKYRMFFEARYIFCISTVRQSIARSRVEKIILVSDFIVVSGTIIPENPQDSSCLFQTQRTIRLAIYRAV